ncbi:MAG: RluA family pseudouridine synthase [Candidatus Kapabacteria bacterium]|nr:RluA family pseudouridine synthase [Candidatus Kapabacteria bacterium]
MSKPIEPSAVGQRSAVEWNEHTYEFTVASGQRPERVDAFLTHSIVHATRTRVQKAIDAGAVTVNARPTKSNYKIRPGDVIRVVVMRPPPLQLIPQDIPLSVLYEDEHLMVIDKAAGILVHPGLGNRDGTLVNAVLWHLGQRDPLRVLKARESWGDSGEETDAEQIEDSTEDEENWGSEELGAEEVAGLRPGIVHRLDRDTTGVMVIGKNYSTTMHLAKQFADRTVSRQYIALAWGVIAQDNRLIESELGRSPRDRTLRAVVRTGGKYAATDVTVLERFDCASLIACSLRTGRTHQIRVHLSHTKHPLVGDADYGGRESAVAGLHTAYRPLATNMLSKIHRQALHARMLGFTHPVTRERMSFESPLPSDMQACLDLLRDRHAHASANPRGPA